MFFKIVGMITIYLVLTILCCMLLNCIISPDVQPPAKSVLVVIYCVIGAICVGYMYEKEE